MTDQAATQSGAAPAQSQPAASEKPSIHERLKAHLSQSETVSKSAPATESDEVAASEPKADGQVDPNAKAEAELPAVDDVPADGQETEQRARPTSMKELAEALQLDVEDIMGIDFPTKIDGKEGTARLRDLLKSYQFEGHLNQKSMAFADERKAFELETQRKSGEFQQKVQHLDAALQVGQRLLDGEFSNVKWDELQASDPIAFNAKVVEYQQRQQALDYLSKQIGQERAQDQQKQAQEFATWQTEQRTLLESKIPEWNDKAVAQKQIQEMATVLNEAYGLTEKELKSENDHRLILIARDAYKWQQLQKAKPDTLKKVQAAPKLLRPGVTQSRATQDSLATNQARDTLRRSGKVSDAANMLKRLGVV